MHENANTIIRSCKRFEVHNICNFLLFYLQVLRHISGYKVYKWLYSVVTKFMLCFFTIKWEKAISFQPQVFDLWHFKRSLANVILRKFMQVYNSLFMMWHYNLSLRHYFGVELFPVIWTTTIKDVITQRSVDETSREEETRQVTIYKCNYCRNTFLRNFVLKDS